MSWAARVGITAVLVICTAGVAAVEVRIELVDAAYSGPLELWTGDQALSAGTMRVCMPAAVTIDGDVLTWQRHAGADDVGPIDGAAEDALIDDLGGLAGEGDGQDEPTVASDRWKSLMGTGATRALVVTDLDDGDHVLHPGDLRLSVADDVVRSDAAALTVADGRLTLRCVPFDICLPPAGAARVRVLSGDHVVLDEPAAGLRALRVWLPPSAQPYAVAIDGIAAQVALDRDGVQVVGAPTVPDGTRLLVDHHALVVVPPVEASAPRDAVATSGCWLFTDRNRACWLEGERIEVSLRAAPGVASATLTLRDGASQLALGDIALSPAGAAELVIDSARLRPATYELVASAAGVASNALTVVIAPALPRANLPLVAHAKWCDPQTSAAAADMFAASGYNLVSFGLSTNHGAATFGPDVSAFDAWSQPLQPDPERLAGLGPGAPPELAEPMPGHARVMEQFLARGIRFLPNIYGSGKWMILYPRIGDEWREHEEDRVQAAAHAMQELRRYPNLMGMMYCSGDGPTPATSGMVWGTAGVANFDIIHDRRLERLRQDLEREIGAFQVDTGGAVTSAEATVDGARAAAGLAWGFAVGEDQRLHVRGDDAKAIAWATRINDLYPATFRAHRAAIAPIVAEPLVMSGSSWGLGAGVGMHPGLFARELDHALNDQHGDFGVAPLPYVTGSDLLNMGWEGGGGHPWETLDMSQWRERGSGLAYLLQGLSRAPAGIGTQMMEEIGCGWAGSKARCEDLGLFFSLASRFGDVLRRAERRDEVAVISSFAIDALGGQPMRQLWAAHWLTCRAGYQPTFVTDARCARADGLAGFRIAFLPGIDGARVPRLAQAIAAFRGAGGLVVVDASTSGIESDIVLPFAVPTDQGPSNQVDFPAFEGVLQPLADAFKAAVTPRAPSWAQPAPAEFIATRLADADLDWVVVANDAYPAEGGAAAQFAYRPLQGGIAPTHGGVVYDALRRTQVDAAPREGRTAIAIDAHEFPGGIYLLAPRPIVELVVTAPARVERGAAMSLRAVARDDAGGEVRGRLPLRWTVRDPTGAERYALDRATNDELVLKIAANDPVGTWTWRAEDQATGLVAEGGFAVVGDPVVAAVAARPPVDDAGAIVAGLRGRAWEIPLTVEERALLPAAERLAAALVAQGVDARVRVLPASAQAGYPMQWDYLTIEDRAARDGVLAGRVVGTRVGGKDQNGTRRGGVDYAYYGNYCASAVLHYRCDVILLGRRDLAPGPLIGVVERARMLRRPWSASFPATGDGCVGYAWAPFAAGRDAIVAYGADEAGLERALAALLATSAGPAPATEPPLIARRDGESGGIYHRLGLSVDGIATTTSARDRVPAAPLTPAMADVAAPRATGLDATSAARLGDDLVAATGTGIGRFARDGACRWFVDGALSDSASAVQAPRRCVRFAVSADGSTVAAAFVDLSHFSENTYRTVQRADVALIDAASGAVTGTAKGWNATALLLADDGSACLIADEYAAPSRVANPRGVSGIVLVGRDGGERAFVALAPPFDRIVADAKLGCALISFADARRAVAVVDLRDGGLAWRGGDRVDLAIAAAPDGDGGAISWADGAVERVGRDGTRRWRAAAIPGRPEVLRDGRVRVIGGTEARVFDAVGAPIVDADAASMTEPALAVEPVPAAIAPPATAPWWTALPEGVELSELDPPFAGEIALVDPAPGTGATVTLPAVELGDGEVLLLTFTYRAAGDGLRATWAGPHGDVVVRWPASTTPRPASLALRGGDGAAVRFNGVGVLSDARLGVLDRTVLADLGASAIADGSGAARVMVPALPGLLGDPRVLDQCSYGLDGRRAQAAGLEPTDLALLFDGDPLTGTALWSNERRAPIPWAPRHPSYHGDLRGAHVVIEFERARTISALGLWQRPGDLPIADLVVECCDAYSVDGATKTLQAGWRQACVVRGNIDPYRLVAFAPQRGRVWRVIVAASDAAAQQLAGLELLADPLTAEE